jgi:hypothetical protein
MIVDMRIYQYTPSKFQTFLKEYADSGFAVTTRHLGRTIGVMTSCSGVANRTLQLFAYEDADHRDACRIGLRSDPEWLAYIRSAGQYIVEQTNTIIRPTDFSPIASFDQLADPTGLASDVPGGMLFELRSYIAKPGKLPEALALLRDEGCLLTDQYVERPIAYFTAETGPANRILMLWAYRNDGERDRRRDAMRSDERFQALGARFNPLFSSQECDLWLPTPYSPLR